MANGDKATAVGWTIAAGTDDLRTGYDKINYAEDRAAEQFTTLRDTVLPAINQPVFACQRSANWATVIKYQKWTPVPGVGWATPILNSGFTSWSAGQLKIKTAGVYRVQAHVQFPTSKVYNYIAAQIVKNTTDADTNVIAKNHPLTTASVDVEGLVRLVAGDVITLLVRQDNTDKWDLQIETSDADLTFSAEWVRA